MTVLIISDTHGRTKNLVLLMKKLKTVDMVLHLGDIGRCEEEIESLVKCPVYYVSGNNDLFCEEPLERIINIGKYKIFMAHGHRYFVKGTYEHIKKAGEACGADIVLFGHTHIQYVDMSSLPWLINPGSISLSYSGAPSYILMDIDREGEAHFHTAGL